METKVSRHSEERTINFQPSIIGKLQNENIAAYKNELDFMKG